MRRFLLRRAAQTVVVVLLVATLTFALIHLAPGDPFSATLENPLISPAVRAQWRAAYGLDRPLPEQYWRYLASVAHGELGYSFSMHRPVAAALAEAVPHTLLLMGLAILVSFALGTVLGVLQAVRHGSLADRGLGAAALFFYAMPDFWLALMAMLVFAYWVPAFPVGGVVDPVLHEYMGPLARAADRARHLVLPVATLALLNAAVVARYQRAAMLDVVRRDFVRTARAKGLPERAVVYRHALRNALLPTITLLGLSFPALLGGAVFVERVFSWPGMGLLAVNAIAARDYPLVTASVMLGGAMVAVGSFLADLLYAAVDPRLRESA